MTYAVNPVVTINDVVYSDIAINGITLTNGRTTVDEQPRAGYATISLVTPDNTYPSINIDDRVVVKVDDSAGNPVTLWTGWVSDIVVNLPRFGEVGWLNSQQITAVGSLAKLNRRLIGSGGYPQQLDGERIANILTDTAGFIWSEYSPPSDTWADINPLIQWQNIDILVGNIDEGDFEIIPYTGGDTSGLALAQSAAASGLGVLYETPDGRISYDDYTSRVNDVAVNGFTDINSNTILTQGLSSSSRLSDLVNDITINYGTNQVEQDSDATSIAVYGRFAASVNTLLVNQIDAQQRTEYYLTTRSFPRRELDTVNLVLHLDDIDPGLLDALLPMTISKPIRIDSLPDSIYEGNFIGFVEGFTWTINRNELFLTLNISEYAFSQLEMNWLQVPDSLIWSNVNAALQWQEARVIA